MTENRRNPWKATAIGMALVMVTALATGIVVAAWTGKDDARQPGRVAAGTTAQATTPAPVRRAAAPSQTDIDACNAQARAATGDRTTEVVKDALIGGAVGAGVGATAGTLYGLNQTGARDARAVEAYRACRRARGHTG